MASKITILGTAGDPLVVGQQSRGSGGFVLTVDEVQFHIDPGPGALVRARLYGINPRQTTAVLVSHNHLGHCGDLNAVVSAMTHGGLDKRGVVAGHESAITSPALWDYYQKCVERTIPLQPGKRIGIEHIDILATTTKHSTPGVGFKLFCPRFTLSYLGDTGFYRELVEEYLDSDILVLNVVDPSGSQNENNLTTDDAIKIITIVKPTLAVLTHFGTKMIAADPIYEARKVQMATKVQVIAARDGQVIEPRQLLV